MQQWLEVRGSGQNQDDNPSVEDVFLPLTPEILVPRIGEYLVENQYISPTDLNEALEKQKDIRTHSRTVPLLGQVLVSLGRITQSALDQAITELILYYRQVLEATNRSLEQRVNERTVQLKDAAQKLAESNQEKANFISNISHELRTPLTHIKGYSDLLFTSGQENLTEEQRQMLQVIQRSSDRLENLIDDLILFATTHKGGMLLIYHSFSLAQLADQLIRQHQPAAIRKNIALQCAYDEDVPPVIADEGKISWALSQLLDNALKFTPENGEVWIKISRDAGAVLVQVIDNGIGIPENRLSEIFVPFHQLDGSNNRAHGGTGLGLSIVKRVVESHQSQLLISSTPGKGSCFGFHIKLS